MDPTVTTDADGVVHITAELQMFQGKEPDEQPAEQPQSDPVADVLSGVARGVGKLLGYAWDAIKPSDTSPPEPEEE